MSHEDKVFVPTDAERAARRAELARQEAELLAEIARRRKLKKIIAVSVVLGAVLLWLGVAVVRRVLARAEVHALLNAIRERGEPLVPAHQARAPVLDDEGVAALLAKALDQFNMTEKLNRHAFRRWRSSRKPPRAGGVPLGKEGQEELLKKAMLVHQDTIKAVREALEQSRTGTLASSIQFWGAVNAATKMAELLSASALLAATQGRRDEALADIVRAMAIADMKYAATTAWDIDSLEMLDARILQTLSEVLATTGCQDAGVRAIIQSLERSDFADIAVKVMEQHQANTASCADFYLSKWFTSPKVFRSLATELRYLAKVTAAAYRPPWVALPRIRSIGSPRPNPASTVSPAGAQLLMESTVRSWTRRDVARVGLALEFCRSEKGECPAELDALAPEFLSEVPSDPFTGKPLRYIKTDKGFVVYSVGPNLSDDGGMPGTTRNVLDIPWSGGERASE